MVKVAPSDPAPVEVALLVDCLGPPVQIQIAPSNDRNCGGAALASFVPEQLPPGLCVLVVHEDVRALQHYYAILERLGLTVRAHSTFAAGVACLDAESFVLIVVSQGGRAFEGACILARVKEIGCNTPVLVVTGRRDSAAYMKAWRLGAVSYLKEPVATMELVRLVRTHLHYSRRTAQAA
jgi:DNA-binding NtrC family response regulator